MSRRQPSSICRPLFDVDGEAGAECRKVSFPVPRCELRELRTERRGAFVTPPLDWLISTERGGHFAAVASGTVRNREQNPRRAGCAEQAGDQADSGAVIALRYPVEQQIQHDDHRQQYAKREAL